MHRTSYTRGMVKNYWTIKYIIDTLFVTEQKYVENGLLNGVENVTNTQTYLNTHISDDILLGKGNGTIETMDGQNIT